MLSDILDVIWNGGAKPAVLTDAVSMMSESQILEAAMIHVAVLLGLDPVAVAGDKLIFQGTSVNVLRSPDGKGDIHYDDLRLAFVVEGIRIDRNDGPTTMAALLDLFQYARDHSDSLLYLPSDQRVSYIADIARRCHVSETFAQAMLSRFSSLHAQVAA